MFNKVVSVKDTKVPDKKPGINRSIPIICAGTEYTTPYTPKNSDLFLELGSDTFIESIHDFLASRNITTEIGIIGYFDFFSNLFFSRKPDALLIYAHPKL